MKNQSLSAGPSGVRASRSFMLHGLPVLVLRGLLLALVTLSFTSCKRYYKLPTYNFAGRPFPPSQLQERVLVGLSGNGTTGALEILDGNLDIRTNLQDTVPAFNISGYSSGYPSIILNFPEQTAGLVYSNTDGSVTKINYSTEAAAGSAGSFPARSTALATSSSFGRIYSAEETIGELVLVDNTIGQAFGLNLPNVYQVVTNQGDTVTLAMTRNSNTLYRIFKLNQNQYQTAQQATAATGSIDCQPFNVPIYCVVPVPGTYDRPSNAYFSLDGTTTYILNSGPELGGQTASVSLIPNSALVNTNIPGTTSPAVTSTSPSPVTANIPVPGGVTTAISDGTTLYLAGQSPNSIGPDGKTNLGANPNTLFAGYMTTVNLASQQVTATYSISDGFHSQMLFADDNTLWVAAQHCANGVRQALFAAGNTTQAANYNCLSRFDTSKLVASIVPAVNQGSNAVQVPYPNTNQDPYYYGDLTGLCWVQNLHKVYTAYGGQVHAFHTADSSEINNINITVQGTALSVAYMDALTNEAD